MHNFVPDDDASYPAAAPRANPEHTAAIKRWTRELMRLPETVDVTVSEFACRDPGCPLLETVVVIFDPSGATRRWRFTRPNVTVTRMMLQQTLAAEPERTAVKS